MRGRLRVVGGDGGENTSWAEVPAEYWSRVAGDGAIPVIPQPSTPLVGEIPPYVGTFLPFIDYLMIFACMISRV